MPRNVQDLGRISFRTKRKRCERGANSHPEAWDTPMTEDCCKGQALGPTGFRV